MIRTIAIIDNFTKEEVFEAISNVNIRKQWDKVFSEFKIVDKNEKEQFEVLYMSIKVKINLNLISLFFHLFQIEILCKEEKYGKIFLMNHQQFYILKASIIKIVQFKRTSLELRLLSLVISLNL
jgi:hypothetical protein